MRSRGALSLLLTSILAGGPVAAAQLPPAAAIPEVAAADRPNSEQAFAAVEIHGRPDPVPVVFEVAPSGSDDADGHPGRPFATLTRAQAAVRAVQSCRSGRARRCARSAGRSFRHSPAMEAHIELSKTRARRGN